MSSSLFEAPDELVWERALHQCTRCGLCLSSCPTFRLTGFEMYSPRGRLELMGGASDRAQSKASSYIRSCLRCALCEVSCPTAVPYGALVRRYLSKEAPESLEAMHVAAADEWTAYDLARRPILEALARHAANIRDDVNRPFIVHPAKAVLVTGFAIANFLPDIAARAKALLRSATNLEVVTLSEADLLSLPWTENGLEQEFSLLVDRVLHAFGQMNNTPPVVVSLDCGFDAATRSLLLARDLRARFPRIWKIHELVKLPSPRLTNVAIDRTLTAFDADTPWMQFIATPGSPLVPDGMRAAGAAPTCNATASQFLGEVIRRKREWLSRAGFTSLLSTDPMTLLRHPVAVHPLQIIGTTNESRGARNSVESY